MREIEMSGERIDQRDGSRVEILRILPTQPPVNFVRVPCFFHVVTRRSAKPLAGQHVCPSATNPLSLLTLPACCISLIYATWWQQWDVCFLFIFGFSSPTANNLRPPRHTKKGDPRPVSLKPHATISRVSLSEGQD